MLIEKSLKDEKKMQQNKRKDDIFVGENLSNKKLV